jgi:hypothetical protein
MNETQRINFSVNSISPEQKGKPVRKYSPPVSLNATFQDMVDFIKAKNLPKNKEEKLIKALKNTPHGSYNNFKLNYKKYLK